MRWIILQDLINTSPGDTNRVGYGRKSKEFQKRVAEAPESERQALYDAYGLIMPFEFRLLDDDGEIYYVGACGDLEKADGDNAFAPLDWAAGDVGCTTMEYRKHGETEWKIL